MPFHTVLENLRAKAYLNHIPISLALLVVGVITCVLLVVSARLFFLQDIGDTFVTSEAHDTLTQKDESVHDTESISAAAKDSTGDSERPNTRIFVHVAGAVQTPGLYELDVESRVQTAIQAAGGFLDDSAQDAVNLAALVHDGEQIYIPTKEEVLSGNIVNVVQPNAASSSTAQSAQDTCVHINSATATELETIPGIGPATAAAIIADREAHGLFTTIEDITRVRGIGEKKLAAMRDYICL